MRSMHNIDFLMLNKNLDCSARKFLGEILY